MTIADEKLKSASERHMLFKITPKRYINDSLVFVSGIVYSMTQTQKMESVERNGVALSNGSSSTPIADEWYHDESTNTLYVGLSSAPNEDTNVIISLFNLFVTGSKTRYVTEDPLNPSSTIREWEPKLVKEPSVSQSVRNLSAGVFSISNISIDIIDVDSSIKDLLDIDTSFNNSSVTAWQAINDLYVKIYQGKVKSISPKSTTITLKIDDNFSSLFSEATMGDAESEITATRSTYPDLDSKLQSAPIPYFFGKSTHGIIENNTDHGSITYKGLSKGTNVAINISNSSDDIANQTDPDNNIFILGRVGPGGIAMQDFGTITAISHPIGSFQVFVTATGHNYKYGDGFSLRRDDLGFDTLVLGEIIDVSTTGYTIQTRKIFTGQLIAPANAGEQLTVANIEIFIRESVQLRYHIFTGEQIIGDKVSYYSLPIGHGLTTTQEVLDSGNILVKIDLRDVTKYTQFNVSDHKLIFTMTPADSAGHSEVVEKLCELSGLTINTASFAQAQIDLDESCIFQLPFKGQRRNTSYLKVIERIMQSTLGILYLNNDIEVNYNILSAPTSGDKVDDKSIINNTSRVLIEYNDIYTKLEAQNSGYSSLMSVAEGDEPFFSSEDNKAKYLNNITKKKNVEHVLEDFVSQGSKILNFVSNRRVEYTFDVATDLIDSLIGDDLSLSTFVLIGGLATEDVKIISIKKSSDKVTATATDLKGL